MFTGVPCLRLTCWPWLVPRLWLPPLELLLLEERNFFNLFCRDSLNLFKSSFMISCINEFTCVLSYTTSVILMIFFFSKYCRNAFRLENTSSGFVVLDWAWSWIYARGFIILAFKYCTLLLTEAFISSWLAEMSRQVVRSDCWLTFSGQLLLLLTAREAFYSIESSSGPPCAFLLRYPAYDAYERASCPVGNFGSSFTVFFYSTTNRSVSFYANYSDCLFTIPAASS